MENEIEYMRKHPPRCLGTTFRPATAVLRAFMQEELGEHSTAFMPVCECSHEFVNITSSRGLSPTSVSCPMCGKSRVVFDPTQHGYDGELGLNVDLEMDTPETIVCSECGCDTLQLALCFQYSGETDVLEDDDAPDVQPEDLFGWVMIAAQCEKCGALQEVVQNECA